MMCVFGMRSGVLLGHVVSEEALVLDVKKLEAINNLEALSNVKELG